LSKSIHDVPYVKVVTFFETQCRLDDKVVPFNYRLSFFEQLFRFTINANSTLLGKFQNNNVQLVQNGVFENDVAVVNKFNTWSK